MRCLYYPDTGNTIRRDIPDIPFLTRILGPCPLHHHGLLSTVYHIFQASAHILRTAIHDNVRREKSLFSAGSTCRYRRHRHYGGPNNRNNGTGHDHGRARLFRPARHLHSRIARLHGMRTVRPGMPRKYAARTATIPPQYNGIGTYSLNGREMCETPVSPLRNTRRSLFMHIVRSMRPSLSHRNRPVGRTTRNTPLRHTRRRFSPGRICPGRTGNRLVRQPMGLYRRRNITCDKM